METGRIKIALKFLKDGEAFKVGDIRLGMENANNMFVTGWTQYSNLENLSKSQALEELNHIKVLFGKMADASPELQEFIQDKNVKYNLAFNYGMGAIGICSEKDGVVKWEADIKE